MGEASREVSMPAHSARAWARKGRRRRGGQERWRWWLWSGSGSACARWWVRRERRLARSGLAGVMDGRGYADADAVVSGVRGVVEIAMRRGRWNAGRQADRRVAAAATVQILKCQVGLAGWPWCRRRARGGGCDDAWPQPAKTAKTEERHTHAHTHAAGDRQRRGTRCEAREGEAGSGGCVLVAAPALSSTILREPQENN